MLARSALRTALGKASRRQAGTVRSSTTKRGFASASETTASTNDNGKGRHAAMIGVTAVSAALALAWATGTSLRLEDASASTAKRTTNSDSRNSSKSKSNSPHHVPSDSTGSEIGDVVFQMQTLATAEHSGSAKEALQVIDMEEVGRHHLAQDAWVVVDGKVYDVTDYHKFHPGGSQIIVQNAGRDVTELFRSLHPPNTLEINLTPQTVKGMIDPEEAARSRAAYETEQKRIADGRDALPDVETMLSLDDIQEAAESFLPLRTTKYYGSASLDEYTKQENRDSFRKCRLLPRILRNVAVVKPQTKLFGLPSALPIYISPSSNALLGHPDGELNIVRGAAKTGIIQGVSAASSFSLTDILQEKDNMDEETGTKLGMVYQVYFQLDRNKTRDQVREAVEGGCQALILTVDSCVGDLRQSASKFNGARGDASPGIRMDPITQCPPYHDPTLNWDDHLQELKSMAGGLPIYLKGVCQIEDVRLAQKHGLAGCILSNHGGRQLDQARTGFDSLRAIHAADPTLSSQIELYVDGGIRRGTDVLQALAFGAKGVGLGRPFLYAQAAYGEKGVIRSIRILENEIVTAMRLLGLTSVDQITPNMVECLQEVWK